MIDLNGVWKVYPSSAGRPGVVALRNVNLRISKGEFVAVVGPSGAGKSTLLDILGCITRPSSGRYTLLGQDTGQLSDRRLSRLRNRSIGVVFQSFNLIPEYTVRENVELPLVYARLSRKRRPARIAEALELVGLPHRAEHLAGLLSGGEQQRTAIARALVCGPELLLADEPTGSIDPQSSESILEILGLLHRGGRTVVIVTHDPNVAAVPPRAVRMSEGSITADGRKAAEIGAPIPFWSAPPRLAHRPGPDLRASG